MVLEDLNKQSYNQLEIATWFASHGFNKIFFVAFIMHGLIWHLLALFGACWLCCYIPVHGFLPPLYAGLARTKAI